MEIESTIEQHFDKTSDVTVDGSPLSGEREPGECAKGTIMYNIRVLSGMQKQKRLLTTTLIILIGLGENWVNV